MASISTPYPVANIQVKRNEVDLGDRRQSRLQGGQRNLCGGRIGRRRTLQGEGRRHRCRGSRPRPSGHRCQRLPLGRRRALRRTTQLRASASSSGSSGGDDGPSLRSVSLWCSVSAAACIGSREGVHELHDCFELVAWRLYAQAVCRTCAGESSLALVVAIGPLVAVVLTGITARRVQRAALATTLCYAGLGARSVLGWVDYVHRRKRSGRHQRQFDRAVGCVRGRLEAGRRRRQGWQPASLSAGERTNSRPCGRVSAIGIDTLFNPAPSTWPANLKALVSAGLPVINEATQRPDASCQFMTEGAEYEHGRRRGKTCTRSGCLPVPTRRSTTRLTFKLNATAGTWQVVYPAASSSLPTGTSSSPSPSPSHSPSP